MVSRHLHGYSVRVGFVLFDEVWTGGVHYLFNLISSLMELPGSPIKPVLLVGPDISQQTLAKFQLLTGLPAVKCDHALVAESRRPFMPLIQSRAEALERLLVKEKVEVLFHHGLLVGSRFNIPTLGWIPDFQHRRLPQMFGPLRYLRRELFFQLLIDQSTHLMVSSVNARRDCEDLYARTRGKVTPVNFAVRPLNPALAPTLAELRERYQLPGRYFFLPNQVWRHKNHLVAIEAMLQMPEGPVIVATGSLHDQRDPRHPAKVRSLIRQHGLETRFRMLGQIPHEDVLGLMLASQALLNPSMFEGWSTVVEEAKAYGIPMVLSDLAVHREQAPPGTLFFDPLDPSGLAKILQSAWKDHSPKPDPFTAIAAYETCRRAFAVSFFALISGCVQDLK